MTARQWLCMCFCSRPRQHGETAAQISSPEAQYRLYYVRIQKAVEQGMRWVYNPRQRSRWLGGCSGTRRSHRTISAIVRFPTCGTTRIALGQVCSSLQVCMPQKAYIERPGRPLRRPSISRLFLFCACTPTYHRRRHRNILYVGSHSVEESVRPLPLARFLRLPVAPLPKTNTSCQAQTPLGLPSRLALQQLLSPRRRTETARPPACLVTLLPVTSDARLRTDTDTAGGSLVSSLRLADPRLTVSQAMLQPRTRCWCGAKRACAAALGCHGWPALWDAGGTFVEALHYCMAFSGRRSWGTARASVQGAEHLLQIAPIQRRGVVHLPAVAEGRPGRPVPHPSAAAHIA